MPTTTNTGDLVTYTILAGKTAQLTAADELPQVLPVMEIHIEEAVNKIPTATLTVADGNVADQDFEVSGGRWLAPGTYIEIKVGYNGNHDTLFKGIVIANSHQIHESNSMLIVICKHETVRMTLGKKSRYYENVNDADVAEQLFSENEIGDYDIAGTGLVHEQLFQNQVSDWDFLISRLDVNGLYYTVKEGKIMIARAATDQVPVLTLAFGTNILSFEATTDARTQSAAVVGYAWDPSTQDVEEREGEASLSAYGGNPSGDELAGILGQPLEMRLPGGTSEKNCNC